MKNIDKERYYTSHCAKLISQSCRFSGGYRVCMSTDLKAKVIIPEAWVYNVEVDWEARKCYCSCQRPYQTKLPCVHVMAMLFDQYKTLDSLISWTYSCYNWMNQYTTPLAVVRVNNFSPRGVFDCFSPTTRVPWGQLRKERIHEGGVRNRQGLGLEEMTMETQREVAINRGQTYCSTCEGQGHNTRTCRRPHTWL